MFQYIVDASLIVKWIDQKNELLLDKAWSIFRQVREGKIALSAPDLLPCEVFNALIRGKQLTGTDLSRAISAYFAFPITLYPINQELAALSARIAEEYTMTFYDAIYVALAIQTHAPLITHNAKHQAKVSGNMVIDLKNWTI